MDIRLFLLFYRALLCSQLDAAAQRAKAEDGSWGVYYWQYLLTGKMAKTMFGTPLIHFLIAAFSCLIAVPLGTILAYRS